MENLNIQNTTATLVGDKFKRIVPPKKVKLRPDSKTGIIANLAELDEKVVEMASVEPAVQTDVSEVTSEDTNSSELAVNSGLQPPVASDDVKSAVEVKEETSASKVNSKLVGLTFYDLKGKVKTIKDSLPKGLKLKIAKEEVMVANVPELISTPVAVIEEAKKEVEMDDDAFQTIELQIPEGIGLGSADEIDSDLDMQDIDLENVSNGVQDDGMEEIETEPIFKGNRTNLYSFEKESDTDNVILRSSHTGLNSRRKNEGEKKEVVPIYELCEAIDVQRSKTKEAEEKANRLTKDFQDYKEKSQIEIDESYREVKEAGDSQTEAESRYQIAEQEHQTALQNLISTGKSQQKMLKQRQQDADNLIKKVVKEREQLERTNETTLAQNQVQLQKYLGKTIDLNAKTQEMKDEAARWDAIARAMQDPEEDLMGYISSDGVYEFEDRGTSKGYGKAA